jgi:hypothetical protein
MSGKLPIYITPPSLDAYPFITAKMIYTNHNIDTFGDKEPWPDEYNDAGFEADHFGSPSTVDVDRSSILTRMTDSTFERLFGILKLCFHNFTVIPTKAELSRLALRNADLYVGKHFRPDQLDAYLLADLKTDDHAHWGDLAALYNESSPDQQRVISDYFEHFKNRSLVRLLSVLTPSFNLPASFDEPFLSKTENGQTFLFSDIKNAWRRDDELHRQFTIEAVKHDLTYELVACAPTLPLALGKATLFVQTLEHSSDYIAIRLLLNKQRLAGANIYNTKGHQFAQKLTWRTDKVGADFDFKKISAQYGNLNEIFTDTLLAVERKLGVQWSKVQKLEDELGL